VLQDDSPRTDVVAEPSVDEEIRQLHGRLDILKARSANVGGLVERVRKIQPVRQRTKLESGLESTTCPYFEASSTGTLTVWQKPEEETRTV
jgi:hypothetical protein